MAIASVPPEAIRPAQIGFAPAPTVLPQFLEMAQFAKLLTVPPKYCESLLVALALVYRGYAMPVPYRGHC